MMVGLLLGAVSCKREQEQTASPGGGETEPIGAVSATPTESGTTPTALPPGPTPPAGPFVLPEVDKTALPALIRTEISAATTAARISPDSPREVATLGMLCYVHSRPEHAVACLARAAELEPANFAWMYYLGLAYEKGGKPEQARAAYERAIGLKPDYAAVRTALADLLLPTNRGRACELYAQALERDEKDPKARLGLGRCAQLDGHWEEAEGHLRRTVEIAPAYAAALQALAETLQHLNKQAEAEEVLRQLTDASEWPEPADAARLTMLVTGRQAAALAQYALAMLQRGNLQEATTRAELAFQVDPRSCFVRRTLATVRGVAGRNDDAVRLLQQLLEERPDDIQVKSDLANAFMGMNRLPEAEELLQAVRARRPRDLPSAQRLAQVRKLRGDTEGAVALLREMLQSAPQEAALRFQLGELLVDAGKDDEALREWQQGLELAPGAVAQRFQLGVLLRRRGERDAARAHWQQCLQTDPAFASACNALVDLALEDKQFDEAEALLRTGLNHAPKAAVLANALAWLLATAPQARQRNGDEAVRLAEAACEATQSRNAAYLDTLAAAYAEAGRYGKAIETQQLAIRLAREAGDTRTVTAYEGRLRLYQTDRPFRQSE